MAYRAQKIALKPSEAQEILFHTHVDFARVAYNAAHSEDRDAEEWMSVYDIKRAFNAKKRDIFPEFAKCCQVVAKNAIHDFEDARKRYRSGQNRKPKRKTHKSKPSFQIDNGVDTVKISDDGHFAILPKIGRVRLHEKPRWTGEVRRAVVSRIAGRWYLSILVDVDEPEPPDTSHLPCEGVDVGVGDELAILSDGTVIDNPRALRKHERKLRRKNKALARKVFRSQNWWKAKAELARLHHRIANIRTDCHHKATTGILSAGISALGIESLSVKGLMKNRKLSKSLADASLGGFLVKLKYKAVRYGVRLVQASRWFPSTQRCSSCGYRKTGKAKLKLSQRAFHCHVCGFIAPRDVNSAINLRQLASSTDESLNACGDTVRPNCSDIVPTQDGWHRNPHTRGRSRKPLTSQIIIDYAGLA